MNAYRTSLFATLLVGFLSFPSTDARADEPPAPPNVTITAPSATPPSTANAPSEREWYGWQTLLVDAASVTSMYIGAPVQRAPFAYAGVAGYSLGGPVIHAAHGRLGAAGGDLAIRLAAPIAFGVVGYAIDMASSKPCDGEWLCFRGLAGAALGGMLGMATAIALDASVLSYEKKDAPREAPKTQGVQWTPSVAVTPQGASAGVAGVF